MKATNTAKLFDVYPILLFCSDASTPFAAAYSRALISVGVLMAMIGYIIDTGGLLVGKILSLGAV